MAGKNITNLGTLRHLVKEMKITMLKHVDLSFMPSRDQHFWQMHLRSYQHAQTQFGKSRINYQQFTEEKKRIVNKLIGLIENNLVDEIGDEQ